MRSSRTRGISRPIRDRNGLRPPESAATPIAALKVIASIVANITLLTALLFYFGFLYTQVFFAHFRVHYTILGQSADEILARGVDGLFIPLAALAVATLVVLCVVHYLRVRLRTQTWQAVLRGCTPPAAIAGLALVVVAVIVAANPDPFRVYAGLPGLGFALGVLLLLFTWRQVIAAGNARHSAATTPAELGITFLLVTVGLFWSVSDYSGAVGTQRALEVESSIPTRPNLLVYSAKSLNLTDDIHQVVCTDADAAYRYRYDGLKLLLQSGGQYVLLPTNWSSASGTTIVLPRTDSLRLEFTTPSGIPAETC